MLYSQFTFLFRNQRSATVMTKFSVSAFYISSAKRTIADKPRATFNTKMKMAVHCRKITIWTNKVPHDYNPPDGKKLKSDKPYFSGAPLYPSTRKPTWEKRVNKILNESQIICSLNFVSLFPYILLHSCFSLSRSLICLKDVSKKVSETK